MNILILLFSILSFAAAERKLDAQFLTYKATASGSSTPASGFETCYVKTDGFMYCKNSAGVEHRMQDSGQNSIKFTDAAGTYTYEIRGATPSGNILWDLPSDNGAAANYFLKNNGSGLLSWASPSGSSTSSGGMKAFWQGYHDDDCSFQVSTKDTQTQISDTTCTFVDSGPESTSFPTVSTSTDGGSTEYAGITFTTTMAGVYEVCAQYEVNLSDAGYVGMNMYDTTGGTRTANMNFRVVTANDSRAIRHCGFFTFAAGVTPNIRIETYISGGTGTLTLGYSNGSTAGVFETIKWSIKVYEQ